MRRNRFIDGLKLLFGGTVAFAVIQYVIPLYISGTDFSENIMTYLVPLGAFTALIVAVLFIWFRPRGV